MGNLAKNVILQHHSRQLSRLKIYLIDTQLFGQNMRRTICLRLQSLDFLSTQSGQLTDLLYRQPGS